MTGKKKPAKSTTWHARYKDLVCKRQKIINNWPAPEVIHEGV